MPAVTTEGIILKRKNFGEADRMVTVLTDRYGKITVVAKGVRRITSRRAGNIELLNRVKLHLFKSRSYNLSEAESIETFSKIKENLSLSTQAFHVLELLDRLVAEEQRNPQIYDLTVSILHLLESNPRQIFIRAFEVKILSILGFWSIDAIPHLHSQLKGVLEQLEDGSWNNIDKLIIDEQLANNLQSILQSYIEKTLEGSLHSVKVFKR